MAEEHAIDEFTLVNHISTGSATQVWEVTDRNSGDRHYAMKILLPEAFSDSEQKQVLKHEAKLLQRFNHPNLIRFHKLVMNKQRGYLAMEYFRAPNLKSQLQAEIGSVRVRFNKLVEQLCSVLGYMHDQGWVHRDIKPDNVLFNKASDLRLIDFSLTARAANAVAKMISGKGKVIQGTRTYISPETIMKAPPAPQADIYSLGVTLYEVLAGEPPFVGSSPDDLLRKHLISKPAEPSAFNPNVTAEMDRFILRMLAKKTKDRQKDMQEVLVEFRNIKAFKEDALDYDKKTKQAEADRYKMTLDKAGRLDGRADHIKQQLIKTDPEYAKVQEEERKKEAAVKSPPGGKAGAKAAPSASGGKTDAAKPAAGPAQTPARGAGPNSSPNIPAMPPQPPPPQQPSGAPMYSNPPYAYPGYPPGYYPPAGYPSNPGPPPGYPGYSPPGYAPAGYPAPGYPAGYPGGYPAANYPGGQPQGGYPQPSYPGYPGGGPPPAGYPPGSYPAGGYPAGNYPPGNYPSGNYPPGNYPPGNYPPGNFPPASFPPGNSAAGNPPPGNSAPGSFSGSGSPQNAPAAPPQVPPRAVSAAIPPPPAQPAKVGASPVRGAGLASAAPASAETKAPLTDQQQLLQDLLQAEGTPAGASPGTNPAQRPEPRGSEPPIPLMDQLPPVR